MKFPKKTVRDVPIEGKTVLMRADFNVPFETDGTIADDSRIRQALPTIEFLLERKCRVVLCAHLGRPEGRVNSAFTLEPIAKRLRELLSERVTFIASTFGDGVKQAVKRLEPGEVMLLENLRFYAGEEENDPKFARLIQESVNADYFVQDGFGVVHRAHASTSAITHLLPSVSGLLLEHEWLQIEGSLQRPKRPFIAVMGGAKISDKIRIIERFIEIADTVIIGGAMANNFLRYRGFKIGKSLSEEGLDEEVERIYALAHKKLKGTGREVDDFIVLPTDVAVATSTDGSERRCVVSAEDVAPHEMILDIGTASIEAMSTHIVGAGTVIWNGTLGFAEVPQFSHGSARLALQLAQQTATTSIIGGGDTADFVLHWDANKGESFTHVSTGGGASLELMAGDPMPGIDALLDS